MTILDEVRDGIRLALSGTVGIVQGMAAHALHRARPRNRIDLAGHSSPHGGGKCRLESAPRAVTMRFSPYVSWLLLLIVMVGGGQAAQPRFAALLAGGQRLQGDNLTDWHDKSAMPRLEGQALLEPSN